MKICENLDFAIGKMMFSNFVGPPQLNRDRYSTLVCFYWTTTDKLKFADWSQVNQMFGSGEIGYIRQGRMIALPPWTDL